MSCYATYAWRDGVKVFPQSSTALLRFRPDDKPISVEDSRQTRDEYWGERYLLAAWSDEFNAKNMLSHYGKMMATGIYPDHWGWWPEFIHAETAFGYAVDYMFRLTAALDNINKYNTQPL